MHILKTNCSFHFPKNMSIITVWIYMWTCLAAPFAVVMLAKWGIAPPRAVEPLITAN
uniref:Uncharacterized protein n=1 Tax=Meloidogyne incognita TaxID=6306 RepID=A0A914LPL7_MELIC